MGFVVAGLRAFAAIGSTSAGRGARFVFAIGFVACGATLGSLAVLGVQSGAWAIVAPFFASMDFAGVGALADSGRFAFAGLARFGAIWATTVSAGGGATGASGAGVVLAVAAVGLRAGRADGCFGAVAFSRSRLWV